jgi:hypothetical protein
MRSLHLLMFGIRKKELIILMAKKESVELMEQTAKMAKTQSSMRKQSRLSFLLNSRNKKIGAIN